MLFKACNAIRPGPGVSGVGIRDSHSKPWPCLTYLTSLPIIPSYIDKIWSGRSHDHGYCWHCSWLAGSHRTLIYPVLALGEAYYVGPHTWARTGRIVSSEKHFEESDYLCSVSLSRAGQKFANSVRRSTFPVCRSKYNPRHAGLLNRFPIELLYLTVYIDSGREIVYAMSEEVS